MVVRKKRGLPLLNLLFPPPSRRSLLRKEGWKKKTMLINNRQDTKQLRKALRNNATPQEVILWARLRNSQLGFKFRRQFSVDNFILDLGNIYFLPPIFNSLLGKTPILRGILSKELKIGGKIFRIIQFRDIEPLLSVKIRDLVADFIYYPRFLLSRKATCYRNRRLTTH